MADPLYFSVWFPDFDEADMLPLAISVMKQFPFSEQRPGITYLSVHPVSWNEATVLERRFTPGITPEEAALVASELLHDDYAYGFEAFWDLWILDPNLRQWSLQPTAVQFLVQGVEFGEQTSVETGHIQVDMGLDSPFLGETDSLTLEGEERIRIAAFLPADPVEMQLGIEMLVPDVMVVRVVEQVVDQDAAAAIVHGPIREFEAFDAGQYDKAVELYQKAISSRSKPESPCDLGACR